MDKKQIFKKMQIAIQENSIDKVMDIVNTESDCLEMMTPFGTWLHIAASNGKLAVVKKFVELGIDINKRGGTFGGGAIERAASEGYIEIVEYLISYGAEIDTSEPERNILFAAIQGGHLDIVKLLMKKGIDTTIKYTGDNMTNMDAIAFAKEQGQEEIFEFIRNNQFKH
ncbi:ankyrin repeat domain-containing protein [Clostridium estertheticum]|uniref:ankyrin repeat domain-containing protein n=1 Tax=Clostridium estertheticum TaxID=238834 RepID=UPI001CF1190C|nr:ankyrin repeat domain-containing protein [Clostridium estertheticum]MCB2355747.1 ankyrin repeat domain-containing protein [Clostridium estertheticum]WAG39336.1 ankyrin repeat domain-containing protein [Clostridium estertheticum]